MHNHKYKKELQRTKLRPIFKKSSTTRKFSKNLTKKAEKVPNIKVINTTHTTRMIVTINIIQITIFNYENILLASPNKLMKLIKEIGSTNLKQHSITH